MCAQVSEYQIKDATLNNNLTEMSNKVDLLTTTLDKETTAREKLDEQV